ncbi:hypothetical protein ABT063_10735 [Streptomyces sp. NPDC002838]|uniref:hypothetical protein n=1 Tax=Streptomyces sp. NPDC002838 TaxID=3154436 RepID=UPI0033296EC7
MLERLADLVGPPTPRAFTLTFAGRERHDGQAPTSFVVNAANLDDAARVLAGLPSWHEWYQADAARAEEGADVIYMPEQSHAGPPSSGHFVDLRGEQSPRPSPANATAPSAARHNAPATGPRPAAAPASPAARTPIDPTPHH